MRSNELHVDSLIRTAEANERNGQWKLAAEQYVHVADRNREREDQAGAKTYYHRALYLYTQAGCEDGAAEVYARLGRICELNAELDQALQWFKLVVQYREEERDLEKLVEAYNDVGFVRQRQQIFGEAEIWLKKALALAKTTDNYALRAKCCNTIANLYLVQNLLENAEEWLEESRRLYEKAPADKGIANLKNALGRLCMLRGENDRALTHFKEGLDAGRNGGSELELAVHLGSLATFYRHSQQYDEAMEACNEALGIYVRHGHISGRAHAELLMSEFCLHKGDYPQAKDHLDCSQNLSELTEDRVLLAYGRVNKGNLLLQEDGDRNGAIREWTSALLAFKKLGMQRQCDEVLKVIKG